MMDVCISPRVSRPGAFCFGINMFEGLSEKFSDIISSIKGKAVITEEDFVEAEISMSRSTAVSYTHLTLHTICSV